MCFCCIPKFFRVRGEKATDCFQQKLTKQFHVDFHESCQHFAENGSKCEYIGATAMSHELSINLEEFRRGIHVGRSSRVLCRCSPAHFKLLAELKSVKQTSSPRKMILDGLMSWCRTPLACIYASADERHLNQRGNHLRQSSSTTASSISSRVLRSHCPTGNINSE